MQEAKTQELIEALENNGYDWRSYSGRGMNGKECVGVRLDKVEELFDLGSDIGHCATHCIPTPDTDSMGKGVIAYWPEYLLLKE